MKNKKKRNNKNKNKGGRQPYLKLDDVERVVNEVKEDILSRAKQLGLSCESIRTFKVYEAQSQVKHNANKFFLCVFFLALLGCFLNWATVFQI